MKNKLMLIALSLLTVSFVQANKPYVDQDLVNVELKKIETKPYLDVESLHKQSARLDAKEKAVQSNYPVGSKKSFVDQFKLWGSNHLRYVQSTDKFTIRGKNISDEQVSQIPLDVQSNAIQKAVQSKIDTTKVVSQPTLLKEVVKLDKHLDEIVSSVAQQPKDDFAMTKRNFQAFNNLREQTSRLLSMKPVCQSNDSLSEEALEYKKSIGDFYSDGACNQFAMKSIVAGAATGFAKKPNMLLLAAKSVKSIPPRGKVGLGMAIVGAAGTAAYKKYYNSQEEQSGSDKIESSVKDNVAKDITDKAPELIKEPSKIEALTRFQNLKANTWDAELFGYKNGGKVATTAALTVAIGGVSYAAYKAYVYRHVLKAYISSKNPFKKSN